MKIEEKYSRIPKINIIENNIPTNFMKFNKPKLGTLQKKKIELLWKIIYLQTRVNKICIK